MLIRWMRSAPKRTIEILLYLHYLGMASSDQLGTLLGIKGTSVSKYTQDMNKKTPESVLLHRPQKRSRRAVRLGKSIDPYMYSLGVAGKRVVEEYLQQQIPYYQNKGTQAAHYWGVNNVLVQLIEALGHKEVMERVEWYNNRDARKLLITTWEQSDIDDEQVQELIKNMIVPDSYLHIDQQGYMIEFDNDSEDANLGIKPKCRKYIATLVPVGNKDPVIWIAPTTQRRDTLKQWWEEVQAEETYQSYQSNAAFYFPSMHFFTTDDVPAIVVQLAKKSPSRP
jgi:hypothetical protein